MELPATPGPGAVHSMEALGEALRSPMEPAFDAKGLGGYFSQLAAQRPEEVALVQGDSRMTFRELDALSNRIARWFAYMGVEDGRFVGVVLPNSPTIFAVAIASWKLGAIPLPLSRRLPAPERASLEALARPALIVGDELIDRLAERWTEFDASPINDCPTPRWVALASGGSTGMPKLIVQEHGGPMVPNCAAALGMRPGGAHLVAGPLYHAGPFVMAATHLLAGGTVVIMERFDAEDYLAAIDSHRVTWSFVVPTMMHRVVSLPAETLAKYDLSSLSVVMHGAAACAEFLKRKFMDLVGPERVWEYYAASETPGALIRGDDWLMKPGSAGRPWLEFHVLDDEGNPLPAGEIGELFVQPPGDQLQFSYHGADVRRFRGLLTVGDMGYMDEDGYLFIADRRTDMIISGGANVFPAEVEAALLEHPEVVDAVVVGLPDPEWGAQVHAIVQLEDVARAASEEDLRSHARSRLAAYKVPKHIEFVASLPRDPSGKIRRSQLRDERVRESSHDGA